jgi:hypothetical protein
MRQPRCEGRRPPDKSHALVVGKAEAYKVIFRASLLLLMALVALVGGVLAVRVAPRPTTIYDYVVKATDEEPSALPFPEGTQCRWLMGYRGERALCTNSQEWGVIPRNCVPDGSGFCKPIITII